MTELPLTDIDSLPVGRLQTRIRSLTLDQLQVVEAYEREHAGRVELLTAIEQRLDELRAGAEPSPGDPAAPHPGPEPR